VDEQGALFQQEIPGGNEKHLMLHQKRFFSDLLITRSMQTDDTGLSGVFDAPLFFRLSKNRSSNWIAEARTPPRDRFYAEYTELRLITEGMDLSRAPHLLVCDDHEFNSLEHGDGLFHAAGKYIMAMRKSNRDYPIYITGIEFTRSSTDQRWSTVELLQFKKRLEARLNVELKKP
jgi:adenylate cyclase class 1